MWGHEGDGCRHHQMEHYLTYAFKMDVVSIIDSKDSVNITKKKRNVAPLLEPSHPFTSHFSLLLLLLSLLPLPLSRRCPVLLLLGRRSIDDQACKSICLRSFCLAPLLLLVCLLCDRSGGKFSATQNIYRAWYLIVHFSFFFSFLSFFV